MRTEVPRRLACLRNRLLLNLLGGLAQRRRVTLSVSDRARGLLAQELLFASVPREQERETPRPTVSLVDDGPVA